MRCGVSLSRGSGALVSLVLPTLPDFPTVAPESWFGLVGERELDPVLDPVIGCGALAFAGENDRFTCEWLVRSRD